MQRRPHDRQQQRNHPNNHRANQKHPERQLPPLHDAEKGVQRDRKHKHAAGDIADLHQPRLAEASAAGRQHLALVDPVEGDEEGQRLLQVRQQQVVDQQHVLVVADVAAVVLAPRDQPVRYPRQQRQRRDHRQQREDADGPEAQPQVCGQWIHAVGPWEVGWSGPWDEVRRGGGHWVGDGFVF
ncbi:hypothetical protein MPH_11246 [Macrophomina phaseolina MS6]|uniref:Uncharacterized protein n=1 Tax=Macrophomina phaseolina (strain MS6) TaxID=1126212 RepID=K2RFT4_MACPH|nr:hypothetical protein MPH_11246 [Macrophomina phaseolina MS6]